MDQDKKFINLGYSDFKNLISKNSCEKLNSDISKIRLINKNIFLSKKAYFAKKKKNKKKNILDNFNLDFIFKDKNFLEKVSRVLNKDFEIYAKRIICGIPNNFVPSWITDDKNLDYNNLGEFIKPKYRDIRFFRGIDYHQDFTDFPKGKGDFITVYIYLSKVTKKMSPINLATGTHLGGPSIFPHFLKKNKGKITYKSDNGKIINSKNLKFSGDAGDVLLWHNCLLHGTKINNTSKSRFSLRLILRQKKNNKNSLMNIVNKKIMKINKLKKIVGFEKMCDFSRYKTLGINKKHSL
jgi:hypothetical protein